MLAHGPTAPFHFQLPGSLLVAQWLPSDPRGVRVLEAGHDFDVVKVSGELAPLLMNALKPARPGCIHDLVSDAHLWLIPAGSARYWQLAPDQGVAVLGRGWHVSIPGEHCDGRRRWTDPGPALTCAEQLWDVLQSVTARPVPGERNASPPPAVIAVLPGSVHSPAVGTQLAAPRRPVAAGHR
ncbi:hypothetical protein KCMC57_up14250 [Kitasatospora sp. CMC57]|uniref:Uncharacterized protein n=1 Tax=Kitasatospora sp. CMC57 TaxID=3231513 RepID=A0AB33JZD8_9ACTN